MTAGEVLDQLDGRFGATVAPDAASALALARDTARRGQAVLATGSLAVAADIRAAAGVPVASDPPVLVNP